MLTKLQTYKNLDLFNKRFVFNAPGEAPQVEAPKAEKPNIKTDFIDADRESALPEQADLDKPLAKDTLDNVIANIDKDATTRRTAIAEYAKQPGADQQWALAQNQALIESAGAAKQHFREKWERYSKDLEAKRQATLKSVVDDLAKTAEGNVKAREQQVKITGANYAEFKKQNPEWAKQHEEEVMKGVYAMGENLYESGALRKINQYDSEVGDDKLSNYQEGRYFEDVVGDTDRGNEETNTEQYTQGLATAILAMYGQEAEQKFGQACRDNANEDVAWYEDKGLYKSDANFAAAEVIQGADSNIAKEVMSELHLPQGITSGYAHPQETLGFMQACLLTAQKALDGDMYEKYVQYLKTKINDRPKHRIGPDSTAEAYDPFDYRQIMNPITFRDAYLKNVAEVRKSEASKEVSNFTEQNQKLIADAKGKIEAAKKLWQDGSAIIESASRADLPQIREISDLETVVKSIEGNPSIIANVDLSTHASAVDLAKKVEGLQSVVLAQLETKFEEKRVAAQKAIQAIPGFKVLAEMEDGKHPELAKEIQADPTQNYILQSILTAWTELGKTQFTAKTPGEIQAAMDKISSASTRVTQAVAVLSPILIKPDFDPEKAKVYAGSKRGVELRDLMDALGTKTKDAKYYSAFKSLEEGDGHVKILVQDKDGWHPVKFQKGKNIFKQMKEMGLGGSKIAIDTRGIDKAVAKYGDNWKQMQRQYRHEYAGAFNVNKPRTAVAKSGAEDGRGAAKKGGDKVAPAAQIDDARVETERIRKDAEKASLKRNPSTPVVESDQHGYA